MENTFKFSESYQKISTLDMHTGGEPLRIILSGYPQFENKGILEIRSLLHKNFDHIRKALMWEPRGHADMYGLLRVPAERTDSDFGMIFMHNEGYSTMCGHATIAIAKAAVMLDWVTVTKPLTSMKIDAPCGQLTAHVTFDGDKISSLTFENVPSFYVGTHDIEIEGLGTLSYDLAYGGAFYAYLDVAQLNIQVEPKYYSKFIELGKVIKTAIQASAVNIEHPFEPDLSFLYGTIFTEGISQDGIHSRNVCVFADGEVDRCATGSGVSGRVAIEYAKGNLDLNTYITIQSIIGSEMKVQIIDTVKYGPYEAVIPSVSGHAYFSGHNEFWIDPDDPLKDGFLLR